MNGMMEKMMEKMMSGMVKPDDTPQPANDL